MALRNYDIQKQHTEFWYRSSVEPKKDHAIKAAKGGDPAWWAIDSKYHEKEAETAAKEWDEKQHGQSQPEAATAATGHVVGDARHAATGSSDDEEILCFSNSK